MALPIYRGFSTANYLFNKKKGFTVTNQECVKQDLLNHIYTIPGERYGMPEWGTRIPLLAFEPLDEKLISIIREDMQKVIDYDPRVESLGMSINALPDQNAVVAFIDLRYIELDVTEVFKLQFKVGG